MSLDWSQYSEILRGKVQSNPDERKRDLERRASQEDTPEVQAKVLQAKLRSGEILPEQLELAAWAGHPIAKLVKGDESTPTFDLGAGYSLYRFETKRKLLSPEGLLRSLRLFLDRFGEAIDGLALSPFDQLGEIINQQLSESLLDYFQDSPHLPLIKQAHKTLIEFLERAKQRKRLGRKLSREIDELLVGLAETAQRASIGDEYLLGFYQDSLRAENLSVIIRDYQLAISSKLPAQAGGAQSPEDLEDRMMLAAAWKSWELVTETLLKQIVRHNPDEHQRDLERQASKSQDLATQAAFLQSQLRSGAAESQIVQLAAIVGHPVARAVLGMQHIAKPVLSDLAADWSNRFEVPGSASSHWRVRRAALGVCLQWLEKFAQAGIYLDWISQLREAIGIVNRVLNEGEEAIGKEQLTNQIVNFEFESAVLSAGQIATRQLLDLTADYLAQTSGQIFWIHFMRCQRYVRIIQKLRENLRLQTDEMEETDRQVFADWLLEGILRTNPDERSRDLQRRVSQSQDLETQVAYLQNRLRTGSIEPELVKLGAILGHPVFRAVTGMPETSQLPALSHLAFWNQYEPSEANLIVRRAALEVCLSRMGRFAQTQSIRSLLDSKKVAQDITGLRLFSLRMPEVERIAMESLINLLTAYNYEESNHVFWPLFQRCLRLVRAMNRRPPMPHLMMSEMEQTDRQLFTQVLLKELLDG